MSSPNQLVSSVNMVLSQSEAQNALGGSLSSPIGLSVALMFMAVLPLLMLAVTSYVKISVVLNILRNALGAGQIPSGAIVGLLSLVLSLHVMSPVGISIYKRFEQAYNKESSKSSIAELMNSLVYAVQPLETFLRKHSGAEERKFFAELAVKNQTASGNLPSETGATTEQDSIQQDKIQQDNIQGETFFSIIPAFVLSELSSAFRLGFMIYLPFLVLDLVITNLLVGLGMMMVSPATIALPFKLLLFVSCNGWFVLCRSLVLSYGA